MAILQDKAFAIERKLQKIGEVEGYAIKINVQKTRLTTINNEEGMRKKRIEQLRILWGTNCLIMDSTNTRGTRDLT